MPFIGYCIDCQKQICTMCDEIHGSHNIKLIKEYLYIEDEIEELKKIIETDYLNKAKDLKEYEEKNKGICKKIKQSN